MNIPNAKYTVGDKVFVTRWEGGEDEHQAEGIISAVEANTDYGPPDLRYQVFIPAEDHVLCDFTEDMITERS